MKRIPIDSDNMMGTNFKKAGKNFIEERNEFDGSYGFYKESIY